MIRSLQEGDQGGDRQVASGEGGGVELHPDRPALAADHGGFSHLRN